MAAALQRELPLQVEDLDPLRRLGAELPADVYEPALSRALYDAGRSVHGREVTPFLLERLRVLTGGRSVTANLALLRHNARVAAELRTTFASHYTRRISLSEALRPDVIADYARMATGEKYLIAPAHPSRSS